MMSALNEETTAVEGGVFRGSPLKEADSAQWLRGTVRRELPQPSASQLGFAPPLFASHAPQKPAAVPFPGENSIHMTGIPRLKTPSGVLLRDVTNEMARVAAAEKALRRLQQENDRLKSSEVANHREQAELRSIIATLQGELKSMESVVQDQVVTLKAVSTEMVRLDPYHLIKSRRSPADLNAEVVNEQKGVIEALKKEVEGLLTEKQSACQRQAELEDTNKKLEADIVQLTSSCAAVASARGGDNAEERHRLAHFDELLKGFSALDAFACQLCEAQRGYLREGASPPSAAVRPPLPAAQDLFHVQFRMLSCLDASALAEEWREHAVTLETEAVSLQRIQLVARDPLRRPLVTAAAVRAGDDEACMFDVVEDDAECRGRFTCVSSARWLVTFEVLTAVGADAQMSVAATAALSVSALIAASKRRRGHAGGRVASRQSGDTHTVCLPLQLVLPSSRQYSDAQGPLLSSTPLVIEQECATLCIEVTVTPVADVARSLLAHHPEAARRETTPLPVPATDAPAVIIGEASPASPVVPASAAASEPLPSFPTPGPAPPLSTMTPTITTPPMPISVQPATPIHVTPCAAEAAQSSAASPTSPRPPPSLPTPPPESVLIPTALGEKPSAASWPPPPPPTVAVPPPPPPPTTEAVDAPEASVHVVTDVSMEVDDAAEPPVEAGSSELADGFHSIALHVQSATELLECASSDGDTFTPCNPRVQVWLGEELVYTTPLVYQGRSPSWTFEQGHVIVRASPSTQLRLDVQDVQGLEVDFIGSASLWVSDILSNWPCERRLPVLLAGKPHGFLNVSFSQP